MKNTNIKNINTAGLVGYIVCIILLVLSITAMVTVAIGTAAAAAISKESVDLKVQTSIDISSKGNILDKLNAYIGVDGINSLEEFITEEGNTVKLDDSDLSEVTVSRTDGGYLINTKTNEMSFSIQRVIIALAATFVMLGAVTVAIFMLKYLMKALRKCETPFTEDVIKWMTRFANSLIPAVVLNMICSGLWSMLNNGSTFSMTVNLGSVLLVAVVYLLIVVFKYGATLQQESDETL